MKKIITVLFLCFICSANAQTELYWVANGTPSMNSDIGDCWPRVVSDVVAVKCTKVDRALIKDRFEDYFVANYAKTSESIGENGVSPTSLIFIETGLFATRAEAETYKAEVYRHGKNDESNCNRVCEVKGFVFSCN